jgi:hypothetical protein
MTGDGGAIEVACALATEPKAARLGALNLASNGIGADGATTLCALLACLGKGDDANSASVSASSTLAAAKPTRQAHGQALDSASAAPSLLPQPQPRFLRRVDTLVLANNNLGTPGAALLARALRTNATLTRLDLENNRIACAGVRAICDALSVNCKSSGTLFVRCLNVNHNTIKAAGALALADYLRLGHTAGSGSGTGTGTDGAFIVGSFGCVELLACNNSLGNVGATALADAVRASLTLQRLDVRNIAVTETGAQALNEAMALRYGGQTQPIFSIIPQSSTKYQLVPIIEIVVLCLKNAKFMPQLAPIFAGAYYSPL